MKIYLVGGAVRDLVMGIEPKDKDYVVVGATPADMLALGYSQVGASFPVFLHPKTGEEYALARTERKSGVGYNGFDVTFDPSITLEDDLIRRDLTINAMAMDLETNEIIDPFGGRQDIESKVLRATSKAFADDPVRVLRTARFAARYDFKIDRDTVKMMYKVASELIHVPTERIWVEFQKGLMEDKPVEMINALIDSYSLDVPAMEPYRTPHASWLQYVQSSDPLAVRFALIAAEFKPTDYDRMSVPSTCAKLARAYNDNWYDLWWYPTLSPTIRLELLMKMRVTSDTDFIDNIIKILECGDRFMNADPAYCVDHRAPIMKDVTAIRSVDAAKIAESCSSPKDIKDTLFKARLSVMENIQ